MIFQLKSQQTTKTEFNVNPRDVSNVLHPSNSPELYASGFASR